MSDFERQYYEAESFWAGEAVADAANVRRLRETCELVPQGVKSVLDVGCGNGRFGAAMAEHRPEIRFEGVDRSRTALKFTQFTAHEASIDNLPFADGSFDCITCLQVIEHLPVPIYAAALKELKRVARDFIIIGVPREEKTELNATTCPQCKTRFNVDLHLRSYSDSDIPRILEPEFVNETVIYPMSKERRYFIEGARAWYGNLRRGDPGFMSPICPVCGYTEGDKTHLSMGQSSLTPSAVNGSNGLKKRLLDMWPTYFERGYEVAALYRRSGLASN